jgi:hypothetical protein
VGDAADSLILEAADDHAAPHELVCHRRCP